MTEAETTELRAIVKAFIQDSITHYDRKLLYWDVTNESMQPLEQGVPVDALGQQAHFAPTAAFGIPSTDISGRTKVDDYAIALDTLAETGLPIHITETNFIAPDDPELRAAQAEALLRLWWGHPSVEQIVS